MSQLPPGHRMPPKRKPKKVGTAGQTLKAGAQCGAKKRSGGKCMLAPGWGTVHPGIGKCKLHGGAVPSHVKAAASAEYRKLLGNPIEIAPEDALLWCIKIRAGEVQWLTDEIAKLEKKDWTEDTMIGKQLHIWARERRAAINDLARYSQMAMSLGIEERKVRLMETYAETIAAFVQGLIGDLTPYLSAEGRSNVQKIVRKHLVVLDGGVPVDAPKQLKA